MPAAFRWLSREVRPDGRSSTWLRLQLRKSMMTTYLKVTNLSCNNGLLRPWQPLHISPIWDCMCVLTWSSSGQSQRAHCRARGILEMPHHCIVARQLHAALASIVTLEPFSLCLSTLLLQGSMLSVSRALIIPYHQFGGSQKMLLECQGNWDEGPQMH